MLDNKVALLVGLTALTLAGCPEEDGDDTGAMTTPISDSADDDDGETENPTTDATEGSASMTSDPMTTTMSTGTTEPESTSGSECTEADECITPADCPNPATDQCIACFCVEGDDTGGTPSSSDYGPCNACAPSETPVAIMGIEGCFCSPGCDGAMDMCPTPNEGTGQAACALGTDMTMPTQCALICPVGMEGICPTGATCQDTGMMQGGVQIGLCTHPAG